ncbi:MAG TPA: amidohydrolase family protein [Methylomirabilota bacterium]|nr:amidohydrolase family protein [Methylomirabilota bacterium]
MPFRISLALVTACALLTCGGGLRRAEGQDRPILDTHIHYSERSWSDYSPAAVLAILDQAGVPRAFVSSTPDDGTLRLYEAAPDRIVPVLRPYRQAGELASWQHDPSIMPYLEERLQRRIHRGIGEFHLFGVEARAPVVGQVLDLAARHGIFVHCHCDGEAVEILLETRGDVRVLWAHAGMSADAATVGRLVDRHPRLSVELAMRGDVAPAGTLDPEWRALFLRHPDRFMVGTDTWVSSRWADLPGVQAATRAWLAQLPEPVATRIAWENAERLARPGP